MGKTRKKYDNYYMANIQVVLQRKKLWKKETLEQLMELTSWGDIQHYLQNNGYSLGKDTVSAEDIDKLYRDGVADLRNTMIGVAIPNVLLEVLFLEADCLNREVQGEMVDVDQQILSEYCRYIEEELHPIITQFAKIKLDAYFLDQAFRVPIGKMKHLNFAKGYLDEESLSRYQEVGFQEARKFLAKGHYYQLFEKKVKLGQLSQIFDQEILNLLQPYRYQVNGIESIFAYIFEKRIELFHLRLILKGKLYHVPQTEIIERMRKLDV